MGLNGPWRRLLANSLCVVIFNGAFLGVFVLLPYVSGRLFLFLVRAPLFFVLRHCGVNTRAGLQTKGPEERLGASAGVESPFESGDMWTLALGYGCLGLMLMLWLVSCFAWLCFASFLRVNVLFRFVLFLLYVALLPDRMVWQMLATVLSGLFTQHAVTRAIRGSVCLCYTFVKVCALLVLEMGVLPVLCGALVVFCTLDLFSSRFASVQAFFRFAPWTCLVLVCAHALFGWCHTNTHAYVCWQHWTAGVVSLYYFGRLMLLVRELARPQVLWFLRDPNNFHPVKVLAVHTHSILAIASCFASPVKEMIELPLRRHARRMLLSMSFYGVVVLITFWLPVQLLTRAAGLRISVRALHDAFVDTPLTLLALNLVLPYSLQQIQPAAMVRAAVHLWLRSATRLTGLFDYVMPDAVDAAALPPPAATIPRFWLRLLSLLALAALTLVCTSLTLFVPRMWFACVCV